MVTFLSVIKHAAADCLAHNEKIRKVTLEAASQMDELAKKHGIKVVGGWNVHPKHFQIIVFEAPNFEAMQAFDTEPPISKMLDFYTHDLYVAEPFADMMQRWKQVY